MLEIYFKNVQGARTVMLSAVTIQAMSSLCIWNYFKDPKWVKPSLIN